MRKRLLLASVCIFILPLWSSPSLGDRPNSAQFVAVAGHVLGGNRYCPCDNPESCTSGFAATTGDPTAQDDGATQQNATQNDLTTGFGVALLMLTLWLKLRA